MTIRYRLGRENSNAESLSRRRVQSVSGDDPTKSSSVLETAEELFSSLLQLELEPNQCPEPVLLEEEQRKDSRILEIIQLVPEICQLRSKCAKLHINPVHLH